MRRQESNYSHYSRWYEGFAHTRFLVSLGHFNVIQISGGVAMGHKDGIAAGETLLRQVFIAWETAVDLGGYAKEHNELKEWHSRYFVLMRTAFFQNDGKNWGSEFLIEK